MGASGVTDLVKVLDGGQRLPQALPALRGLVDWSIEVFNDTYAPRCLVRGLEEQLPTHPRHVASVRARMGMLMEFALVELWNSALGGFADRWCFSYNYVTEYPNMYLRNENGQVHLRIETKALHDEADEGAARFDTWTKLVHRDEDVLVILGWRWEEGKRGQSRVWWPRIVQGRTLSAWPLAQERDRRHRIVRGTFGPQGQPFVRSKKTGRVSPDPKNYGKLNRIVHPTRRQATDLHEDVRALLNRLAELYPHGRRGWREA